MASKKKASTVEAPPEAAVEETAAPTSGDVDVAGLSTKKHKGEVPARILVGYWVRLAESDEVPDWAWGHIASVESSPWKNVPYNAADATVAGYKYVEGEKFLVKTRDDKNQLLEVTQDAFAEVGEHRVDVTHHG